MKPARWVMLYPEYLQKTRSLNQGRRVSLQNSIQPIPSVRELKQACDELKIECKYEPLKAYPASKESIASALELQYCEKNDLKLLKGMGKRGGRIRFLLQPGQTRKQVFVELCKIIRVTRSSNSSSTKNKKVLKKKKKCPE